MVERGDVRYSVFPSRRSLDVLWGHVNVVGRRRQLPRLTRNNAPRALFPTPDGDYHRSAFISHNSRDEDLAVALRDELGRCGVGGWIFESEILAGLVDDVC